MYFYRFGPLFSTWNVSPQVSYELLCPEGLFECWTNRKTVQRESCTCLQCLEDWDIILQHLSLRKWLICQDTWLCLSSRLHQRHPGYGLTSSCTLQAAMREFPHFDEDKFHRVLPFSPSLHFGSSPGYHCRINNLVQGTFILAFPNSRKFKLQIFEIVFVSAMTRKGVRLPFLRCLLTLINSLAQTVLALLSTTMEPVPHLKDIHSLSTLHQKPTLQMIKRKYHPKIILKKLKNFHWQIWYFATVFVFH